MLLIPASLQALSEQSIRRGGIVFASACLITCGLRTSEQAKRWFAAFHLRQLIAGQEADAEELKERLKRCEDKLRQP